MKINFFKKILIASVMMVLFIPWLALAQNDNPDNPKKSFGCPYPTLAECQEWALDSIGTSYGQSAGTVQESAIAQRVGQIIGIVLAFLGVLFLFIVVYSGLGWMTAGGNEEKVTKARQRMTRAAIGLIITISAYVLTTFVLSKLQNVQTTPEQTDNACTGTCLDIGTCYPPAHTQDGACQDGQECCSQ